MTHRLVAPVLLVFGSVVACGAGNPGAPATSWVDSNATVAPTSRAPNEPPPAPWDLQKALAGARLALARAPSQHEGATVEAEVFASPEATAYPQLGRQRPLPAGAMLIEKLYDPATNRPAAVFAMVRREPGYDEAGGDWEYLVLTADGRVRERGRVGTCVRCHADAPFDHVFGARR